MHDTARPIGRARRRIVPALRRVPRSAAALWRPVPLLAILIGVGVLLRLYRFTEPILDQHSFRQTQTAATVWLWDRDGFDLLDYRVPMFGGGHWVLEFPVYQAAVWLLEQPFGGIEPAGRLVSIASFVATAVLIHLIVVRLMGSRIAGVAAVAVFTFLPVTVFYFRAVMIDPLLIATTLLAVYAALRLTDRFSWRWFAVLAAALVVSILGKATFLLAIGLPIVVSGVRILLDRRVSVARKASLVVLGAVALSLSALWTRHADDLNLASGSLTFSNGSDWFFGTTFRDPDLFRIVGQRFLDNFGPLGMVLIGVGLAGVAGLRTGRRPELIAMLAGAAVSVGVFANLNRIHDYYQLAYYVPLAMLAGLGVQTVHRLAAAAAPALAARVVVGLVIALAGLWTLSTWSTYFAPGAVAYALQGQGREMAAVTPDERLLVIQENGDKNEPMLWYEARRVGWRVPTADPAEAQRIVATVDDLGGIVFLRGPSPQPEFVPDLAREAGLRLTYESPAMVVYTRRVTDRAG